MSVFTTFLQADWAERTGWTLLHSLWQIAAIAAVYAMAAFLLRGRSANSRYLLGCAAMLAILGLPVGTYVILPQAATLDIEKASRVPVAATLPDESRESLPSEPPKSQASEPPESLPTESLESLPAESSDVQGEPTQPMSDSGMVATVPPVVAAEQSTATGLLSEMRRYMPWATAVWLAGVLLLSLRPLLGWFHVHRLRRRGLSPLSEPLLQLGKRVKERLGVKRVVELVESRLVEVPTVIGGLRPMILLPVSALTGLSTAELELILAHELAHVKRHDWLVNLVQTVIEGLLFYHPAMWWVSHQIRKERENCCDDMAVSVGGSRTAYAHALTRLEEQRAAHPEAALAATGGSLITRIRRLLGQPPKGCGYRYATAWVAGLVTIGLVVLMLAMNPPTRVTFAEDGPSNPLDASDLTDGQKSDPPVKVRVIDGNGAPIVGATVLLDDMNDMVDGRHVPVSKAKKQTDEDGWVEFTDIPHGTVGVGVLPRPQDSFTGTGCCFLYHGKTAVFLGSGGSPGIEFKSDERATTFVFTMQKTTERFFAITDAETGKAVTEAKMYFKERTQSRWQPFSLGYAGDERYCSTVADGIGDPQLKITAQGYYPADFRLSDVSDTTTPHPVRMKPAPEIHFKILTADGKPADGAIVRCRNSHGLTHTSSEKGTADENGELVLPYPALGDMVQFDITHSSGRADAWLGHLPPPRFVEGDGEGKDLISCEVRLRAPASETHMRATSNIQARLIPCAFADGRQWLRVDVSNNSNDMATQLEAGGFPPEILVDGVCYRSMWVDAKHPSRKEPRVVRPGSARDGSEFTLDRNWVRVDGTDELRLTADRHVVQAVLYATEKDAPDDAPRTRILSNPIEIGADGGVVGRCDVKIRVLGGAEKKPLKGLELAVKLRHWEGSVTATTQEDGTATFSLLPGEFYYDIRFESPVKMPYLPIPTNNKRQVFFEHRRGHVPCHSNFQVGETDEERQVEFHLADPCELVLRAVDVDTGQGVRGVAFAMENFGAEDWAQRIHHETLGPREKLGSPEEFQTDQQGYFRRYVGPRKWDGWKYMISVVPPGYEPVNPGEEVEIRTPLGQEKAEHTFLVRRRKTVKVTIDGPFKEYGTFSLEDLKLPDACKVFRPLQLKLVKRDSRDSAIVVFTFRGEEDSSLAIRVECVANDRQGRPMRARSTHVFYDPLPATKNAQKLGLALDPATDVAFIDLYNGELFSDVGSIDLLIEEGTLASFGVSRPDSPQESPRSDSQPPKATKEDESAVGKEASGLPDEPLSSEPFSLAVLSNARVDGQAVLPSGKPAVDAQVAIATDGRQVFIVDGKLKTRRLQEDADLSERRTLPFMTTTDGQGRYRLPTEGAASTLVIVHPEGIVIRKVADLPPEGVIPLVPWGTVDGRVMWGDQPGTGEKIDINPCATESRQPPPVVCSQTAVTDQQGRFRFEKSPPGTAQVSHVVQVPGKEGSSYFPVQFVEVAPGKPTKMVFGGRGRPVVGKVVGVDNYEDVRLHIQPYEPYPDSMVPPDDISRLGFQRFLSSPAGKNYIKADIKPNADGTFRAENVPQGSYELNLVATGPDGKSHSYARFTVETPPESVSDEPHSLGEIKLKREQHSAPDDETKAE